LLRKALIGALEKGNRGARRFGPQLRVADGNTFGDKIAVDLTDVTVSRCTNGSFPQPNR
jgi:hypothetical protein